MNSDIIKVAINNDLENFEKEDKIVQLESELKKEVFNDGFNKGKIKAEEESLIDTSELILYMTGIPSKIGNTIMKEIIETYEDGTKIVILRKVIKFETSYLSRWLNLQANEEGVVFIGASKNIKAKFPSKWAKVKIWEFKDFMFQFHSEGYTDLRNN